MPQSLSLLDILVSIAVVIRILIFEIPSFSLSIAFGNTQRTPASHNIPMPRLLQYFLIRRTTTLLPLRVVRRLTDIGLPDQILTSPRYSPSSIYHETSVSPSHSDIGFRGYWIVKGSFASPSDPATSDIVILYLHGGGYTSSTPASYLLFLLVLCEHLNKAGLTVSIFALDYDLAPEYRFPWQQRQAVACFEWLSEQIGAEKVLVMGDSAGGHLALSMLVEMQADTKHAQPGVGLMLLSPWLTMRPPAGTNEMTDVLSVEFLRKTAERFAGKEKKGRGIEFLEPEEKVDWDEVLPGWVWVAAGRNEVMHDDILRWIVERGQDCKGESRICGEIDRDEAHVYAWLETTDAVVRKEFLKERLGQGLERFEAIQRVAEVIVKRLKNGQ